MQMLVYQQLVLCSCFHALVSWPMRALSFLLYFSRSGTLTSTPCDFSYRGGMSENLLRQQPLTCTGSKYRSLKHKRTPNAA